MPATRRAVRSPAEPRDGRGGAAEFARQVHAALGHLYDPVTLQTHPLARVIKQQTPGRPANAGAALRQQLIDAIEALRPGPTIAADAHAWRSYRLLTLRYVEALEVPVVQAKLAVSKSEYFRDHHQALEPLVSLLRERWWPAEDWAGALELLSIDGGKRHTAEAPVDAPDRRPERLPRYLTSFVGRASEQAELCRLLATTPLLTLTGPGGVGKTRLAVELVARGGEAFSHGVHLVELSALSDGALIPHAIATVLGLQPGQDALAALSAVLRDQAACLVLDNCEHLIDAAAQTAEVLLRHCLQLRIIATSREPLGIGGEVVWSVPPLALPPANLEGLPDEAAATEAVNLFVDRATAVRPAFALTSENTAAVVDICRTLDGLPLALELAAAQIRVLSPTQLAQRLGDRFALLAGGSRTAAARQQTLQATIDWSYDLLSETERLPFRCLSAFAGGWVLEAAEAVVPDAGIASVRVLPLLTRLADKSLVVVEERDGETRYRMLETIRRYGRERLEELGEADRADGRLRDWALSLVAQAWAEKAGPHQVRWLDRLEVEHDNLRAILGWCLEHDPPAGLELASRLFSFWEVRGYRAEGRRWLERLLDAAPAPTATRARALVGLGILAFYGGDLAVGRATLEACRELATELGDRWSLGMALHELGHLVLAQEGDGDRARSLMEEGLALLQALGDVYGTCSTLRCLGNLVLQQGDAGRAKVLFDAGVALATAHQDRWQLAWALGDLGHLASRQGNAEQARALMAESLALYRQTRHRRGVSYMCYSLGDQARMAGDQAGAATWFEESLAIARQIGDRPFVASSLSALGDLRRLQGDVARARAYLVESRAIWQELDDRRGQDEANRALAQLAAVAGSGAQAPQPEQAATERLQP